MLNIDPARLNSLSASDWRHLTRYLEELKAERAKASYLDFVRSIDMPGAPISDDDDEERFYPERLKPALHHRLFCGIAQRIVEGKIRRAMIFAPPGSAKSTYLSVGLPPFAMGRKPRTNIISVSYGSDLARKFGRKCRQIARSKDFSDIFGCSLSADSSAADEWALTNGSEYMSGGILSGVTGNRADGLIIDDPVRGQRDADSPAFQQSTWDAYNSDIVTRLKPGAWQVIIQTRWSERDLSGQLLPDAWRGQSGFIRCKDGHDWYVCTLPMEAEHDDDPLGRAKGDLLWGEYFNAGDVGKIKAAPHMSRTWASLYQQRPAPDEGTYFKREWLRWYETRPAHLRFYAASDWAVTKDGGDYTVHVVVGVDPNNDIYVLDVWRGQQLTNVSADVMASLVKQYQPIAWAEDRDQIVNSIGPFLNQRLVELQAYVAREAFTMGRNDKEMRAQSIRGRAAMGKLYLPRQAPWLAELLSEMLTFPAGRNDDQVDALGLIGRLIDVMVPATVPALPKETAPRDYSGRPAYNEDNDGMLA